MGVYLKETASTYVPSPINVADNLYNRDRPDFADNPEVIEGQEVANKENSDRVQFVVAQQGAFRSLFFPGGSTVFSDDWDIQVDGSDIVATAKGQWIGNVVVLEQGGNLSYETLPGAGGGYSIRFPLSSRRAFFYTMQAGTPVSLTVTSPDTTATRDNNWKTISTWEATESTMVSADGWAKIGGQNGSIYMRFTVNGQQVGSEVRYYMTGQDKLRSARMGGHPIEAGSTLALQCRLSINVEGQDIPVTGVHMDISYISRQ